MSGGVTSGLAWMVIVRIAEEVRRVEHEDREQDHEQRQIERVLHRVIGMEGHRVLRALHVDAERIVVARHMQRPDVQPDHARDDEGQQIVQREEAVQRGVADREIAPQPGGDVRARRTTGWRVNRLVMTVAPQKDIWPQGST